MNDDELAKCTTDWTSCGCGHQSNSLAVVPHLVARNLGYRCPLCGRWLIRSVDFDLFPGECVSLFGSDYDLIRIFCRILSGTYVPAEGYVSCNGFTGTSSRRDLVELTSRLTVSGYDETGVFFGDNLYLVLFPDQYHRRPDNSSVISFIRQATVLNHKGVILVSRNKPELPSGTSREINFDRLNRFCGWRNPAIRLKFS